MSARLLRSALAFGALVALTGCPQCAPDLVAGGVAPLTIRNVGAMVTLVNADDNCGFASADVLGAPVITGSTGSEGTIAFTVTDCEIDLGDKAVDVGEPDCKDKVNTATGKITISATRVVGGILTGKPESPIVPGGPDAVTITITKATFDNFSVVNPSSDASLTMISGGISAVVSPRLAASSPESATAGACAIATPNVSFSDVKYDEGTLLHVASADNNFDVDVAGSNLKAQNGKKGDDENTLSGDITVFGSEQKIDQDLDPDFDAGDFADSYSCTPDLSSPESFECADLNPRLADGAARLSVKMLGTIAGLIEADTTCGFSSNAVLTTPTVAGTVGGDGSLTFTVTNCVLTFAALTALSEDCNGDATEVVGSVTVSGTKVVSGHLSGNAENPVIPDSDQPAAVTLSAVIDAPEGFSVGSTADNNTLKVTGGTLTGVVRPRVYVGADTGVCSVSSPHAGFDDVTWTDGAMLLTSDSGSFGLILTADLDAANGTSPSGTNELTGTVHLGDTDYTVPSDGAGLNPTFDAVAFDEAWQCDPDLADPAVTGAACTGRLAPRVAGGVAALSARAFGTTVSLVDGNTSCGFSSAAVAAGTVTFDGNVGDDDVTATFTLPAAGCTITLPAGFEAPPDCNGARTAVSGTVVVTGTKTVKGWRTGDVLQPIVPNSSLPATFTLSMAFTDFLVVPAGATSSMTVSGTLAGEMKPRTGLSAATNACSIGTPNTTFTGLSWTNGAVTLDSDGNTFVETVTASDIDAQNGSDGTATNTIGGSITVSGAAQALAGPLDPEFDQAAFDATYTCAANGSPTLVSDAVCAGTFRGFLAQGAARLLVKAVATAVSVHDGNPGCGFADQTPNTAPVSAPSGPPPSPGTLTQTSDANCQSGFANDTTIATDCLGGQTHASGAFTTASGTKFVAGLFTGANPPFVPTSRDAATLTLNNIAFTGWTVSDAPLNGPITTVTINSGTASVVVDPIAGRNAAASTAVGTSVFTEKTGIAGISDLTMATGSITFTSAGKTFNLAVTDANIDAFAGAFFDGANVVGSNSIAGTITVDGQVVAVGGPLVAGFDQATFDSTYTCNATLGGDVVPSSAP